MQRIIIMSHWYTFLDKKSQTCQLISEFIIRCYEEDGDSNPEMMMEQALDNEMMFHPQGGDEPSMANSSGVPTTSWRQKNSKNK